MIARESTQEVTAGTVMVVAGGANTSRNRGKEEKKNKKGKGPKAAPKKKASPNCFLCGGKHILRECPEWKVVQEAAQKKRQGNA